jgi:AraC family transcriptional regulator
MSRINPPRLERFGPFQMTGLFRSHRYPRDHDVMFREISQQWREYLALAGSSGPSCRNDGYGIGLRMPDGATTFDYLCAAPFAPGCEPPLGLATLNIPALTCAVFEHRECITEFRDTMQLALGNVLPLAGLKPADGDVPEFIERYSRSFDPQTGLGGFEVLIPLKA